MPIQKTIPFTLEIRRCPRHRTSFQRLIRLLRQFFEALWRLLRSALLAWLASQMLSRSTSSAFLMGPWPPSA